MNLDEICRMAESVSKTDSQFGQAYSNIVQRAKIRAGMSSYVGHEDERTDGLLAALHGSTTLKWSTIVTDGKDKWVQLYPTAPLHEIAEEAFEILDSPKRNDMTLLIPDRERENQDDFIWCLPIERRKWNLWYDLSVKYTGITPKEHGGVRFMNRMEGKEVRTILMMPNEEQDDELVMHACAYLRLVKNLTCRIYVVRCTDDKLSGAELINRVVGTDRNMLDEVTDAEIENVIKADSKP